MAISNASSYTCSDIKNWRRVRGSIMLLLVVDAGIYSTRLQSGERTWRNERTDLMSTLHRTLLMGVETFIHNAWDKPEPINLFLQATNRNKDEILQQALENLMNTDIDMKYSNTILTEGCSKRFATRILAIYIDIICTKALQAVRFKQPLCHYRCVLDLADHRENC